MRTRSARPARLLLAVLLVLLPGLLGCSTNPATGERSFTAFMSPADEVKVGASEDPKVRQQFGGAYDDAALAGYVAEVGNRLARVSDNPELDYRFTVLNAPEVNAFALPGGYVYITRGLLALAGSEAELAGVLAHEIGHVTARHSAERYSRAVVAQIGSGIFGALIGERAVANLLNVGAGLYLQSYSRDQEFEADTLGVRYLTRAGYDPAAMAGFLHKLRAHSLLERDLSNSGGNPDEFNLMATHPRTIDRVERAREAAAEVAEANPRIGRDDYLARLDGMLYGEDPGQGLSRGQTFAHPGLGFAFDVPARFRIVNQPAQVAALGPDNVRIAFDGADGRGAGAMTSYLTGQWAQSIELAGVEPITVNGMEAATGWFRFAREGTEYDLRVVAYRFSPEQIYRFMFLAPASVAADHGAALRRTTYSFRRLSPDEARSFRPHRLRVTPPAEGDTVTTLASRMPEGPLQERRFRVLNGIEDGAPLPGGLVKLVVP
jgi:predicted Zn-dependent protease